MATKRSSTAQDVYQIKVTLLGTKPPIWRRLVVPVSITLAKLHDVLQTAMGWHDCHMHQFCAGDRLIGKPDPEDLAMGMPPVENERTIKLNSVLRNPGAKMIYTYDFGDNGGTPWSLRSDYLSSSIRVIQSASMENSHARPTTAAASPVFTTFSMRSLTPIMNSMKKCVTGSAMSSIRRPSQSTTSIASLPPGPVARTPKSSPHIKLRRLAENSHTNHVRHIKFVCLREDKDPRQVVRE
jgi:hypothetical protein